MDLNSSVISHVDWGKRRAPIDTGEPTGVTVRQHVHGAAALICEPADDLQATDSDCTAPLDVGFTDERSFSKRHIGALLASDSYKRISHSRECPSQVLRGRARSPQNLCCFFAVSLGSVRPQSKCQAIGGSRPYQRSATHDHGSDCLRGVIESIEIDGRELERKPRLIDEPLAVGQIVR